MASTSDSTEYPVRLTPVPSDVVGATESERSLNGTWQFLATEDVDPPSPDRDWRRHDVPGHWSWEDYEVDEDAGEEGWYRRQFAVPPEWTDQRVKLRFDAVYSHAMVWVNGERVGEHEGGYTPFEVDVTDAVRVGGDNTLAVAVREDSDAAELGWRNVTGGIPRSVTLFATPRCHLSSFHVETDLHDDGGATVRALGTVTNEGDRRVDAADVQVSLAAPDGADAGSAAEEIGPLDPGESREVSIGLSLAEPATWDPERPRLYDATCRLETPGGGESVERSFGVREVTVEGNELRINGQAVTLRGVNWEEVHPEHGHAVPHELTRRDARRLREANVNYARIHCQPPSEEFVAACDEVGIVLEIEFPITFLRGEDDVSDDPEYRDLICRQALEAVERDRSHPSVCVWSIANESMWGENFVAAAELVAAPDPTRPTTFNWAEYRDDDADHCAIANHHYTAMRTEGSLRSDDFAGFDRPVLFDEAVHVYCYNLRELLTDPGLRDDWGRLLDASWNEFRSVDAVAGAAIFAGDDHVTPEFRWGIVDAHRRRRPEYWHVKKVYSPVRATVRERDDEAIVVELENRSEFATLDERLVEWRVGGESGTVEADVDPGETGTVTIPRTPSGSDERVSLRVVHPGGFTIDEFVLESPDVPTGALPDVEPDTAAVTVGTDDDAVRLSTGGVEWSVDRRTGQVGATDEDGSVAVVGGPAVVGTPVEGGRAGPHEEAVSFDGRLDGWTCEAVTASDDGTGVSIRGTYDRADGQFRLRALGDGWIRVSYDFTARETWDARELGVALSLPSDRRTLSWDRDAPWSSYPPDHVGRPSGTAEAFPSGRRPAGTDPDPSRPWAHDATPRGSNDFRGTKRNVYRASLASGAGNGLEVRSGGDQHVRAAVRDGFVDLFVLDRSFAGGGGEWFDRNLTVGEEPTIEAGERIRGDVVVRPLASDR